MKTTIHKEATSVAINITLDGDDLESARLKALRKLSGEMKIAGFRKGKAPANLVEKHVDANVLAGETLDVAVRTALPEAFEKNKVRPLSLPKVEVTKYVPGEMVELVARADILPEVKLGGYKKLKAKRQEFKVTDADVKDVLEQIAKQYAETKVVKRKAKLGDEVVVDFVGKRDGKVFEGGSAKDFKLELGSKRLIPGFEEGLVGKGSGDKVELDLTFPEDYPKAELAGAKVVFEVLVKQVNAIEVPKIDDELAKKSGAFESLKELKEDIRKNLTAQNERRARELYMDALVLELVEASEVEAPESLIEEHIAQIREDLRRNLAGRGSELEDLWGEDEEMKNAWEKQAREAAVQRVKSSLVLHTLADELKLKVPREEVEQKVAELKEVYKKDAEFLARLDDARVQADIANRLRMEKTFDALLKANS